MSLVGEPETINLPILVKHFVTLPPQGVRVRARGLEPVLHSVIKIIKIKITYMYCYNLDSFEFRKLTKSTQRVVAKGAVQTDGDNRGYKNEPLMAVHCETSTDIYIMVLVKICTIRLPRVLLVNWPFPKCIFLIYRYIQYYIYYNI